MSLFDFFIQADFKPTFNYGPVAVYVSENAVKSAPTKRTNFRRLDHSFIQMLDM